MTDTPSGHNLPEMTVSEVSGALKKTVETAFSRVRVRGEISQPKLAASGHWYLRLKDDQAVIDAIIWRGQAAKLSLRPDEGLEVIATGRLTTYPGRSSYQIVIETLDVSGEGALLKLLEERRRRLAAEGLFDEARKNPLPFLPRVIGVVTSPTGAVIRDILHRLSDRFPVRVIVWPVAVQGDAAAAAVAEAIAGFNALDGGGPVPRPDVLIVARGGGSLEDLMAFNEECVVRAAAASRIPLISAVGHETDITLIDHAADRRAPTPTGAAEMAVPVRSDLRGRVHDLAGRLDQAMDRGLSDRADRVAALARGLPPLERVLEPLTQRLDDRIERLDRSLAVFLDRRTDAWRRAVERLRPETLTRRIEAAGERTADLARTLAITWDRAITDRARYAETLGQRLESVSHRSVLARGYALVRRRDDRSVVSRAGGLRAGDGLDIEFSDAAVPVAVVSEAGAPPLRSPKRARGSDTRQESFLDRL